ncbi:MAG: serine/threonine protein kinase [Sandaracinaceae bacterium]
MEHSTPDLRLVDESQSSEDTPSVDPFVGQTLDGRYTVVRILGQGGMGLVYEAKHAMLGKRLAIKVLKEEVSRDAQVMERFKREAQSASAIGSQHICDVSDFGVMPDGATYFVMEFLDGPPLTEAIANGPLMIEQTVDVARQLCDALGAAHERGIVHRDLKPDNVHLVKRGNRDDFVKVLDFGIAKVGNAADKKLTQAGQVFGTPHYMSPEQCSGSEVDHRTDIYALGVILYEMVTGQVPFDADNLMGVLTKHVYENPIPPREFPPPVDVPPGLEAVILKCLEKKPDARYASMADLRADLERIQAGATPNAVMHSVDRASGSMSSGSHAGYASGIGVAPAAFPSEAPKSRAPLMIGAAVLLLFLGGATLTAAFLLTSPPTEADATPTPVEDPVEVVEATDPDETLDPEETPTETDTPNDPAVAAPTFVHLVSEPDGAEVLDGSGSLIGNTPLDVPRPAAGEPPLELSVQRPGHVSRQFTVSALTQDELVVRLDPEPSRSTGRGRRVIRPVIAPPTPRPLAPTPRPVTRPASSNRSEILNPW